MICNVYILAGCVSDALFDFEYRWNGFEMICYLKGHPFVAVSETIVDIFACTQFHNVPQQQV